MARLKREHNVQGSTSTSAVLKTASSWTVQNPGSHPQPKPNHVSRGGGEFGVKDFLKLNKKVDRLENAVK